MEAIPKEESKTAGAIASKKWREGNREAAAIIKKRYYEKNKEVIIAKGIKYNKDNKECIAISQKKWYEENKERLLKGCKEYRGSNEEALRDKDLKRFYGISSSDYEEMLVKQGGVCLLCNEECTSGKRLAVDHCHVTGKVRGLLCGKCNRGLGMFNDNIAVLLKAAEYLKLHKGE